MNWMRDAPLNYSHNGIDKKGEETVINEEKIEE